MSEIIGLNYDHSRSEQYKNMYLLEETSFSSRYLVFLSGVLPVNQLSILSLHGSSSKVFKMSNYMNQESVAKHEQQLIDFNAFHFSSTLSMQLFNEGSKHLDHHSEKHSMATIRANTDNIS